MDHVITFVTSSNQLTVEWIQDIKDILAQHVSVGDDVWLEPHEACDVFIDQSVDVYGIIGDRLEQASVDAVCQPVAHRRKKMLISDMDSTMIEQECIDELADFAGLKAQVADITERAMNGELDFKDALRERVKLLKGLSEEVLQEAYDKHISFMPGAKVLVQTMRQNGAYCLLVSGGFTFFTLRVAEALGFHHDESNLLAIEGGVLTGEVIEPIKDKEAKVEALMKYSSENALSLDEVLAVGDGANDLPMLGQAGLGVAYRAKPVVQSQAKAKLNATDLSALLYVQGYKKASWVV